MEEYVWIKLLATKLHYVLSFFLLLMIGIAKTLETTSKAIREVDIFHIPFLLFVPERYMIMYVTKGRSQMSARYAAPHIKQAQISPFKERLFCPSISWILQSVLLSLSAQPYSTLWIRFKRWAITAVGADRKWFTIKVSL